MSLKSFVNDKSSYEEFLEELDIFIEAEHTRLEQYRDPVDLHKSQGAIEAYRKLKKLRDILNGRK